MSFLGRRPDPEEGERRHSSRPGRRSLEEQAAKPIDVETRQRIFDFIDQFPGCHLREIHRRVELPLGTVEYHLKWLESAGHVIAREEGGYKRYYHASNIGGAGRKYLAYIRQDIPRRIVVYLLGHPGASFGDVVKNAGVSVAPSTLSFHMNKLVKAQIVERRKAGRISHFSVLEPDELARLLIVHRRGLFDDVVDRFVGAWVDLGPLESQEPGQEGDGDDPKGSQQDQHRQKGDYLLVLPGLWLTPVQWSARLARAEQWLHDHPTEGFFNPLADRPPSFVGAGVITERLDAPLHPRSVLLEMTLRHELAATEVAQHLCVAIDAYVEHHYGTASLLARLLASGLLRRQVRHLQRALCTPSTAPLRSVPTGTTLVG